jgi:hypothetical protein
MCVCVCVYVCVCGTDSGCEEDSLIGMVVCRYMCVCMYVCMYLQMVW